MSNTLSSPYQTLYSNHSDNAFRALYHQSNWNSLSETQKVNLLQETANRAAFEKGIEPCKVSLESMSGNTMGYQEGKSIVLNAELVNNSTLTCRYGENNITFQVPDSNYRCFETVYHENEHSFQDAVVDGRVDAAKQEKAVYEANDFSVTEINGERACQYMNAQSYDAYYLNPVELKAWQEGEQKAMELVSEHSAKFGEDNAISSYARHIAKDGYNAKIAMLQDKYGEDIVQQTENVLLNAKNGTNIPVNKDVESFIHNEMIETQKSIDNANHTENTNTEVSKMSNDWMDKHVTQKEFDSTLRNSVNNFYQHTKNDPSLTSEEALSQTAQMSEGYLSEMEAFDAAQAQTPAAESSVDASAGLTADAGVSSASAGIDGGADGGCSASAGVGM